MCGLRVGKTPSAMAGLETVDEYANEDDLANHLIRALNDEEFDIARCNRLRENRRGTRV